MLLSGLLSFPKQQPQNTTFYLLGALAFRTEIISENIIHYIIKIAQSLF